MNRDKLLPRTICYLAMIIVFAIIWVPLFYHFYIPNENITDDILQRARNTPLDSELEFKAFFPSIDTWENQRLIDSAEKILQGEIVYYGLDKKYTVPDPHDIDTLSPLYWQKHVASLKIPKILLKAYEVTSRDDFFTTARDMILGWAAYESNAWFPHGVYWIDNCVSERICVLAKFWKLYRNHEEYDAQVARSIFQMVSRSGELLANPTFFNYANNHGVIQNLALWQICIAFPTIPNVDFYKQLAFDRLHDQMNFYINDEGVVLEHSAGYHKLGIRILSMAFRYLPLLHLPIPDDWEVKYQKARDFYTQLIHPDGTLPMFGDTGSGINSHNPSVLYVKNKVRNNERESQHNLFSRRSHSLYPVAGFSIWWHGLNESQNEHSLSQTLLTWSYFPGQAHKHSDEMSIILWADGHEWFSNVGYWTYRTKGRSDAVSWSGSNAPHLVGEDTESIRNTQLKFHGWSDDLAVVNLERRGPQEYIARRQVIYVNPALWIVVDHTSGKKNSRTTTTWPTSFKVEMSEDNVLGSFNLIGESKNVSLKAFFITSEETEIRRYKGSFTPFAGWQSQKPANAIVIEQPALDSWSAAIWSLESSASPTLEFTGRPNMQNFRSPDEWEIVLPLDQGLLTIYRKGNSVYVNEDNGNNSTKVELVKPTGILDKYGDIRTAFKNNEKKYPKHKLFLHYRWKMTYCLIFIFVLQEVFFFRYSKNNGQNYVSYRMLVVLAWFGIIGLWFIKINSLLEGSTKIIF